MSKLARRAASAVVLSFAEMRSASIRALSGGVDGGGGATAMATVTSALTSGALTPVTSTPKVVDSALVGCAARVEGGAVCATSHLTDFAVVSDVLTSPDAFFESFADLNVNLPKAMTLEELLAVLADIEPEEYSAMGLATLFACGLMWLAVLYDDRRAYVEFFPRWHSFLGQEGLGSKILKASITWQAWAAQLTVLLASNHYFADRKSVV